MRPKRAAGWLESDACQYGVTPSRTRRAGTPLAPMVIAAERDLIADDQTLASYVDAFAPAWEWEDLVRWPPDVFALANLVLDQTEGYRFVVAPPTGRQWAPFESWEAHVDGAARAWKRSLGEPPRLVRDCLDTVDRFRDAPLAEVRSGAAWELNAALLTLPRWRTRPARMLPPRNEIFPASDSRPTPSSSSRRKARSRGSRRPRVRILPKTNFSARGITTRSISRYLGLCYEAIDVRWGSIGPCAACSSTSESRTRPSGPRTAAVTGTCRSSSSPASANCGQAGAGTGAGRGLGASFARAISTSPRRAAASESPVIV